MKKKWLLITLCQLVCMHVSAHCEIKKLRLWPSPENTQIVLEFATPPNYDFLELNNPHRLVLDIKDASMAMSTQQLVLEKSFIKKIRTTQKNQKDLSIVFELEKKLYFYHDLLPPTDQYPYRLVIDLKLSEKEALFAMFAQDTLPKSAFSSKTTKKTQKKKQYLIAIDAGHGGEDPGCIGKKGTKEKIINLLAAQALKRQIDQYPFLKAVLIRKGDYYLPLYERVRLARNIRADLFVSLHADSATTPKATGASVFVLSERGASSALAKRLAKRENRSDNIGGVSLQHTNEALAHVLLDLSHTASKRASLKAAQNVLNTLGKNVPLHQHKVESAGFAVLKAPDIPSMLVELGFLSNPRTEKLLNTPAYREKLAKAIASGLAEHIKAQPW